MRYIATLRLATHKKEVPMNYIDFHCDTLARLYYGWDTNPKETLWENTGHLDLNRMISSGYLAQFFACFLNLQQPPKTDSHYHDVLEMTDLMKRTLADSSAVKLALSYTDYVHNKKSNQASCFLTVEEGGILEEQIERLPVLYEAGIRLITLTWNYENSLGYPHLKSADPETGLKPFGLQAVERMEELGMLIDVSHLSDAGFWDVASHTKKPFLASHSCCRLLCGHSRNLTDEMIRLLGERQGVIGVNYFGSFLQENGKSTLEAIASHLRHIINVGGLDVAALGSDFDGISCTLDLTGAQDMPKLDEYLLQSGFLPSEIDAICYKNAERLFEIL